MNIIKFRAGKVRFNYYLESFKLRKRYYNLLKLLKHPTTAACLFDACFVSTITKKGIGNNRKNKKERKEFMKQSIKDAFIRGEEFVKELNDLIAKYKEGAGDVSNKK